jgi:hypothetical protein
MMNDQQNPTLSYLRGGNQAADSNKSGIDRAEVRTRRFQVCFLMQEWPPTLPTFIQTLEKKSLEIESQLGPGPETIRIELLSSTPDLEMSILKEGYEVPPLAQGACTQSIKVRYDHQSPLDTGHQLSSILHEYVHLIIGKNSNGKCPAWLDEGLAVFLTQKISDEYQAELRLALEADKLPPLEWLEKPFSSLTQEKFRHLAYAFSESLADYLAGHFKWEDIRALILATSVEKKPEDALAHRLSLNYYTLVKDWQRWKNRRG